MELALVHGDITTMAVDAIVNAANSSLLGGGGVDGAIHAAGGPQLLAECRELRETLYPKGLPTGRAVATNAGRLPARWVIHTVGPVYRPGQDRSGLLRGAYNSSLDVAAELSAATVAFPLISAGAYGWPKSDAIDQALTVLTRPRDDLDVVTLVLFDATTLQLARQRLAAHLG